jgi:hypothetical protein
MAYKFHITDITILISLIIISNYGSKLSEIYNYQLALVCSTMIFVFPHLVWKY